MKGRGRKRAITAAVVAVIGAVGLAALLGEGQASSSEVKISSQVLLDTAGGQEASFVIYLGDQADVSAAYEIKDQDARGRYVYNTLRQHAAETQAPIRAKLDAQGVSYKSYWARQHDRRRGRPVARRGPGRAPRRRGDRVERRLGRAPGRGRARATDEGNAVAATRARRHQVRRPTSGRSASPARASWSRTRTPACAGRTLRSGRTTAAGTARPPTTTTTGRTPIHSGGGILQRRTHQVALRRQGPRHAHDRHDDRRRRRRQPDRRRAGREVDRLPEHGRGQRPPGHLHGVLPVLPRADRPHGQNADPTKRPHVMNNSWGCPPSEGCARGHAADDRREHRGRRHLRRGLRRQRRPELQHGRRIRRASTRPRSRPGAINGSATLCRASAAADR